MFSQIDPDITLTQNEALTYSTSKDARLDFLFHVTESSLEEQTIELDIRGGKGIGHQAAICFRWLYRNHFDDLLINLDQLSFFGYWKDYLNILLIALFNELPPDPDQLNFLNRIQNHVSKYDGIVLKSVPIDERKKFNEIGSKYYQVKRKYRVSNESEWHVQTIKSSSLSKPIDYKLKKEYFKDIESDQYKLFYQFKTDGKKIRKLNEYRKKYFQDAYNDDVGNRNFKTLYDRIVDLFAVQIVEDYRKIRKDPKTKISLASKWIPNHRRHFDKYLFILQAIAKKFFHILGTDIDVVREKLGDEKYQTLKFSKIVTSLRRHINIAEILMSANQWEQIDYEIVPSKSMLLYRKSFIAKDRERFKQTTETKTLKAAVLTPAHLIQQLYTMMNINNPLNRELCFTDDQVIESKAIENQWRSLVADVRSKGSFKHTNTLAICDVSGSMVCSPSKILPIYGAIGLTLFLMELCDTMWKNRCISFSEQPSMHTIDNEKSLLDRTRQLVSINFGLNTDLNKVFDLILENAKSENLTEEQMPKVIFIFTDMEFDFAMECETNFQTAKRQYKQAGYEMPFVVFWNLTRTKFNRSTPVCFDQQDVLLLSGFSPQTFQLLFEIKDFKNIKPIDFLMKVVENPRYKDIKIFTDEMICE
ncbi:Uncharacterized protein SSS_08253 [Sarcoptes scabiei]|uniref:Uncharacterized protein n=1 Tax=Sarcoptes scabiei TaxID=52283 RepID=A0A834R8I8_SARSC|nr:Uncharacterized protein SSS_08253 [Sarcoptes scabiei]